MSIIQIRYRKYHSSGDKAQIDIYVYIRCAWYCKESKAKQTKKGKKNTVQNNSKKYINKERDRERLEPRKEKQQ